MEELNLLSLIIGALLAMLGGVSSQLIISYFSKQISKKTLLAGLRSEAKVIREDMDTYIKGIRETLECEDRLPRPDSLSLSTVVYSANAGQLGILDDPDLVEKIVEVYASIHSLMSDCEYFRRVPNGQLSEFEVNAHHKISSATQLGIAILHNRLAYGKNTGPKNLHETEEETRKLVEQWTDNN